jgi:hypothetical protein
MNPKLFPDDIPILNSQKKFEEFIKLDPRDLYFLESGCVGHIREMFEKLFNEYCNLGLHSKHFLKEIRSGENGKFHQRTWEMFIAIMLNKEGFQVHQFSKSGKGIDYIVSVNNIPSLYVECNAPRPSEDHTNRTPQEELAQRICQSITGKVSQYESSKAINGFDKSLPYIIALNLGDPDSKHNNYSTTKNFSPRDENIYLEVLFDALVKDAAGMTTYWVEDKLLHIPVRNLLFKFAPKSGFFRNKEYSIVSGIWFSRENVLNQSPLGDSNILILNPFAKNPLDKNLLKNLRRQYLVGGELILKEADINEEIQVTDNNH